MMLKVRQAHDRWCTFEVQRPDEDGDVLMVSDGGCYYTVPSVKKIIAALQRAIRPRRKTKRRLRA